jgi:hypothetical protein
MVKDFIDQLGRETEPRGTIYLPEDKKGFLYKDLTCIQLNNLYTNVIIQLYDNHIIDIDRESADKIRWFLKNRNLLKVGSKTEYTEWKIFVNSFFGKLSKEKQICVTEYMSIFYKELITKFQNDIVYIDCDVIFMKDNPLIIDYIKKLEVPFDYIKVPYFWAESKKRLIYSLNTGEIESKGFHFKNNSLLERQKHIRDIITIEVRNDKLNKIGI